jgi:hypothetical protein
MDYILEAAVLALLIGRIYKERHDDDARWHDIHTKFHDYRFRHASTVIFFLKSLRGFSVGINDGRVI